jgi:outer membrane protein assembly factor BamB
MKYLFAMYVLIITGSLLSFGIDYWPTPQKMKNPGTGWYFESIPIPFGIGSKLDTDLSEPTSFFRQSIDRSGADTKALVSISLGLRTTLFSNLNVGVHDASKASPAVDDSGIYVGSDGGWFTAFNHDGSIRWRHYATDASKGIHSTAALDKKTVYYGTYNGDMFAADKATGDIRWVVKVGETIGASPLLFEDSVISAVETNAVYNGFVVRLNRKTGKVIWRTENLGEQSHSSPSIDLEHRLLFLGANNDKFFAFNLDTGELVWKKSVDGKIKSTSAVVQGRVYFSTWGASLYSLDCVTGEVVWKAPLGLKSQSSPTYVPDLDLFVVGSGENGAGKIFGIDRVSGEILWNLDERSLMNKNASALAVKSPETGKYVAWIGCNGNALCALDPRNGKVLSQYELSGLLSNVPVAFDGALYLAVNEGGLEKLEPLNREKGK